MSQYRTYSFGGSVYRTGIRNGYYVRDVALTALGFSGVENTDWANYRKIAITPLLDIDGNIYTSVVIGAQEWIVENFRSTKYADGSAIPNITLAASWITDITGAYCWYNDDIANKEVYGALYNWYAVNNAKGLIKLFRGGVEESGWRMASDSDWAAMNTFLGGTSLSGGAIKEAGVVHWQTPNANATNSSGLTLLPGGQRQGSDGIYYSIYQLAVVWTSTQKDVGNAWYRGAVYTTGNMAFGNLSKNTGMSVRCVRDI